MDASRRIVILGSGGVEGRSATQFLLRNGFPGIVLADIKPHDLPEGCVGSFGETWLSALLDADVIIRSPGIRCDLKELEAARLRGATVTSCTRIFLEGCAPLGIAPCRARIAAVTGSNGKTTCTTLLHLMTERMWKREGRPGNVWLGGNIGTAVLDFKDRVEADDLVVLELSSFQLEDAEASPWLGVVLNVQPNHLDHHRDVTAYADAKKRCIDRPGNVWAVLNEDDETTASWAREAGTRSRTFSNHVLRVGDAGTGYHFTPRDADGQTITVGFPLSALQLKTYPETLAAAAEAAVLLGCSADDVREILTTFTGIEHRLQFIRTLDGVRYYDDSANTTPDSSIVALRSFPAGKIVIILGGSDKGADFGALAKEVVRTKARVVAMGQMGPKIREAILAVDRKHPVVWQPEFQTAFSPVMDAARSLAVAGDHVLLSPACASFGMFRDYKDRAAQFVRIVQEWEPTSA